ncbi:hypothetical protein B9479_003877 [Cryptococcus floricola]|uniref:ferric-chelate reductase (NADPH) n=1 Tax=Cryptococcus floricola TaxID=2591691 RepID=A0A5D3AVP6_9TREE|nr:hypothetical protein B9479_003877 [Cryptococcus floricola]
MSATATVASVASAIASTAASAYFDDFAANSTTSDKGSSGKSAKSSKSTKKKVKPFYKDYQVWMWYAVCAVIGLLAIYYAFQLLQRWRRQRKAPISQEEAARKRLKPWAATVAGARNWMVATGFPSWLYAPETVADALWTCAYLVVALALTFYQADTWPTAKSAQTVANVFGIMAFGQMPLIMFLVMKNNPISWLTGIPYQNLNYLHRAGTRCIFLWSWIHVGVSTIRINLGKDSWSTTYIIWGWVAISSFTLLWLSSFAIVRRRMHQFFFTCHIIFALLYMVGAYLHWDRMGKWIYMCFIIWGFDRAARWVRTIWTNRLWTAGRGECTIEVLEGDCMRLTFKRYGFTWKAGQHMFVSAPRVSMGPVETHPFTIANAPNDEHEVVVLPRVYGGFTSDLLKAVSSSSDKTIRCYIDGPYGSPHSFASYDHVLMVSGGTGIAPFTAQMLELVNSKKHARTQLVRLVWIVRDASAISWVAPILNQAAELLKANSGNIQLVFDVYVTRGSIPVFRKTSTDGFSFASGSSQQEKRGHEREALGTASTDNTLVGGDYTEKSGQTTPTKSELSTPTEGDHDAIVHLPAAPKELSSTLADEPSHHSIRKLLSPEAMSFVHFHKGRPDLKTIIEKDVSTCPEAMAYGVCGPFGLMETCRTALKQASNFSTVLKGQTPIDFFEETLGQ